MALDLEKLKKIDIKAQHLVFGFVRRCQQLLPDQSVNAYYTIPPLVSYLCLSYFHLAYLDQTKYGKYMILNKEENSITIDKGESGTHVHDWSKGNTIYGNQWLKSNSNMIYEYELEITNIHPSFSDVYIGISSNDKIIESYMYEGVDKGDIYYAQTNWGRKQTNDNDSTQHNNGKQYSTSGDKIKLIIDFKMKKFQFIVNDDENGAYFSNIKVGDDIKYKLAISMYRHGDIITVLNLIQCKDK